MPFLLRSSAGGKVADARFESFARVGSSPECDLVIDSPDVPPHAATVVADGAGACRMVLKAGGLRINGTTHDEASPVLMRVGESVRLNSVTVTLLTETRPAVPDITPIAPEIPRTSLSEPTNTKATRDDRSAPTAARTGPAPPSRAGVGLQIAVIALCLAAVAGMVGWMFVGTAPPAGTPQAARPTLPQIMALVEKQTAWPWKGITKAQMLEDLRRAYQLENLGRRSEARDQMNEIRLALLAEIPQDDRGHFGQTAAASGAGKTQSSAAPPPALTERWFPEPERRALFDAVSAKYAEL